MTWSQKMAAFWLTAASVFLGQRPAPTNTPL